MKVVLISLLPTTENFGIKHIHSYLLSKGHESAIVFIPRHRTQASDALNKFLAEFKPDVVGCGFMSYEASFAKFLGEKIKALFRINGWMNTAGN